MSIYNFTDTINENTTEYCYWENGFSKEEINAIIVLGESKILNTAKIDGSNQKDEYRKSKVSWIDLDHESSWLYNKIANIVRRLNSKYFQYDITGFVEDFQFTIYDGQEQSHYEWHVDTIHTPESSPRKLSFVLQLTDPSEYEGGELQLMTSKDLINIKKELGFAAVFPSFTLHKVTPVTKGIRKSLVIWISGPPFR